MTAISIFGMGYVGCVSAACFAKDGHDVIGVDVSPFKVDLVNRGEATIVETGISELIGAARAGGRLRATTSPAEAVQASTLSLICVGTPSRPNGSLDLKYVERVCEQIGEALRDVGDRRHTVVIRSTVLPGTIAGVVRPAISRGLGRAPGNNINVCMNPEFLREGTSIKDFYDPPFTIVGTDDRAAGDAVAALYAAVGAPIHVVPVAVAEMVKYASNCYHGLKVGFANEIGNICKAVGVDSHEVMRLFSEDRKLNISAAYLKPGFAFGGSCLPKDLRAITYRARELDISTPVLQSVLESNARQIDRAFEMIAALGHRRIGILGMAFKEGTDDLRESPMVALIERLVGKGYELAIYDAEVSQARLIGTNREYIEKEIPHIWSLMQPVVEAVTSRSEVIVIGNSSREFRNLGPLLTEHQTVLDLARATSRDAWGAARYTGICW